MFGLLALISIQIGCVFWSLGIKKHAKQLLPNYHLTIWQCRGLLAVGYGFQLLAIYFCMQMAVFSIALTLYFGLLTLGAVFLALYFNYLERKKKQSRKVKA